MPGYALAVPIVVRSVSRPLWRALQAASAPASIRDLHVATAAHPNAIQLRLKRWERAGLVATTSERPRLYVMKDSSPTPPVMPADGSTKPRVSTARQRLWTAMRTLKCFDLPTLLLSASDVTRRSAEDYVNALCRAGYLRRTGSGNGMTGTWASYAMIRRSGRIAPGVTHARGPHGLVRVLIDRNDGSRHDISPSRVTLRRTKDAATDPVVDGGVG